MHPELLIKCYRGEIAENLHYGWVCILDKNKRVILKKGDLNDYIFLRSTAKPIQAIQIIEDSVLVTDKELAIMSGSHLGSEKHISLVKGILKKNNIHLNNLLCPLNHNCSGKHAGLLCVCKKNDWDLKSYKNPNHPIQKKIFTIIKTLSNTKKIKTATDGCGIPTYALPIKNVALLFSNFIQEKKYSRIINAMKKYSFYVGGKNQFDTEVMKLGNIFSKCGADGILVLSNRSKVIIIKIADGNPKIRAFVAIKLLEKYKWLKKNQITSLYKELGLSKVNWKTVL